MVRFKHVMQAAEKPLGLVDNVVFVEIPDGTAEVGDGAFENCHMLQEVVIPASVTSINACAFSLCRALESIKIPNSVTSIGAVAFHGCTALKHVDISESVPESEMTHSAAVAHWKASRFPTP